MYMVMLIVFFSNCTVDKSLPIFNQDSTFYYLSTYYPIQTFKIELDQPVTLKSVHIILDGKGTGNFDLDIYGHEGGAIFPAFKRKLINTITLAKDSLGPQKVVHNFESTPKLINDYFFLSLSNFENEMGISCDSSVVSNCKPKKEEDFAMPLILEDREGKLNFKFGNLQVELVCENDTVDEFYFSESILPLSFPILSPNQSISWEDVNDDGWMDLLLGNRLYKNESGILIEPIKFSSNSKHSTFIDFDNDADVDIMLFGPTGIEYFVNQSGNFKLSKRFTEFSFVNPQSICISDYNNDMFPDIFIAQLWSSYPKPLPNFLLRNVNGNTLIDTTATLYPNHQARSNFPRNIDMSIDPESIDAKPNENLNKRSRAAQFIDYDQDGDTDLYIVNYFLEEDEFFENMGNGNFIQKIAPGDSMISVATKCHDNFFNHGTGISWFDYDNDGDFDFILNQLAHPSNILEFGQFGTTLFENIGNNWKPVKNNAGIEYEESHSGVASGDLNNDGLEDVILASYYDCRYLDVYLQQRDHSFEMKTYESGLNKISGIYDLCLIDYNNDGKLDISFIDSDTFRIFENNISNSNNWLKIRLRGNTTNSYGIGTTVKVYCGDEIYTKQFFSGRGQAMQSPNALHFGIAHCSTVDKIEVLWASNKKQIIRNVKANQTLEILEYYQ